MDLELKSFGGMEVTDGDKGEVQAVVATLNVVDRDRDVFLPGSFPAAAPVVLSDFDHSVVLKRDPPVGKGIITVVEDKAILTGQFFLGTIRGRDTFERVRGMGPEGQWSIGFSRKAVKSAALTPEWRVKGASRLIAGVRPWEASPVLVGAGVDTATIAVKGEGAAPTANILRCGCGRVLGEAPDPMVFVGNAGELAEVKVAMPRDVRFCVKCRAFAIYVPQDTLTKGAA